MSLPSRIKEWLNARHITDSVIDSFGLGWDGHRIVIPVRNEAGELLFNKYRRDPSVTDGPKYWYDPGSKTALYGVQSLHMASMVRNVVVCEGEMDALCLISKGFHAVSTTGGSSTWLPEWKDYVEARGWHPVIVYDNDEAGYKGSFNVQKETGWGIAWLPTRVGEHGDITDYFVKLGKSVEQFHELIMNRYLYTYPQEWRDAQSKKELELIARGYRGHMNKLLLLAQGKRAQFETDAPEQILIKEFEGQLQAVNRAIKYHGRAKVENGEAVKRAKERPIEHFIKFNGAKFAQCIWHKDNTASMKYYPAQNRVHCYGCDRDEDVIGVVQQQRGCSFTEAVNFILT